MGSEGETERRLEITKELRPALIRAALRGGVRRTEAEDIASEVLIKLLTRGLATAFTGYDLRAYGSQVARNLARKWVRASQRRANRESRWATAPRKCSADPETLLASARALESAVERLRALPERLRRPFLLYYGTGLPASKVAQTLRLPEGTVRSRVRRVAKELAHFDCCDGVDHLAALLDSAESWMSQLSADDGYDG